MLMMGGNRVPPRVPLFERGGELMLALVVVLVDELSRLRFAGRSCSCIRGLGSERGEA